MKNEDLMELDRLLTTYSNEEFAAAVAELCHGKEDQETKRIISLLQEEINRREILHTMTLESALSRFLKENNLKSIVITDLIDRIEKEASANKAFFFTGKAIIHELTVNEKRFKSILEEHNIKP